jgi:hypothetical protein
MSNFTILPNAALQCRSLSILARGLLAYLLSLPPGTRRDIKSLAAESPEGQTAISRAQRELIAHGYMTIKRVRNDAGRIVTAVDVYDTPQNGVGAVASQVTPSLGFPSLGNASALPKGVSNREKEAGKKKEIKTPPTRTATVADARGAKTSGKATEGAGEDLLATRKAEAGEALVARVGRVEPRLMVGMREMPKVAPLVGEWLSRGATETQIRAVLTSGLPDEIRSAAGLMANRLTRHMPPIRYDVITPKPAFSAECVECARPVRVAGVCSLCVPGSAAPARTVDAGPNRARSPECVECARPVKASGTCARCAPETTRVSRSAYTVGNATIGAALARRFMKVRRAVAA